MLGNQDRATAYLMVMCFLLFLAGCTQKAAQTPPAAETGTSPQSADERRQAELAALTPRQRDALAALEGRKWSRSEDVDQMDGEKTVSFRIFSQNKVQEQAKEEKVILNISCGKNDIIAVTSGEVRSGSVRLKFDDEAPITQKWIPGDGVMATNTSMLKRFANAKAFKFEFQPLGRNPQVASFDLLNLKDLLQQETLCKL